MPKDEKSGLGSGLDAIFGPNFSDIIDDIQNTAMGEEYGHKTSVRLSEVHSNPYQPRTVFDEKKLEELTRSIKEHGVFTPILVRPTVNGYQLIAGERRVKASQMAGLDTIPAIIMDFTDEQMMEISLLENIQRENLSPVEEAAAYKQLMENLGYTQEILGKRVGKSREHISNTLRLLRLPEHVQQLIQEEKLSMGHARCLITVEDEEQANKLADKIVAEGLSVRQVEKLVRNLKKPARVAVPYVQDSATAYVERNLQHQLQTRVKISKNTITISYSDVDDLNRILDAMGYRQD